MSDTPTTSDRLRTADAVVVTVVWCVVAQVLQRLPACHDFVDIEVFFAARVVAVVVQKNEDSAKVVDLKLLQILLRPVGEILRWYLLGCC